MKKILTCCAAAALALALCACAADDKPIEAAPIPSEIPVTAEIQQPAPTPAPTAQPTSQLPQATESVEGIIYLTVSQITFSLQGESEDIYVGSLPREIITWGSEDESIAVFDSGVLTATGVGSTTVYAEYAGQRAEVTVGCLAQTQEELESLDLSILRAPKRLPPVTQNPPLEFFEDAVLVGDSITHIMFGYENMNNMLGDVMFLTRGGSGINGFVRYYWNIYYRGQEMKLEDALALTGKEKAFFMLGQNDLGYRTIDQVFESWDILLERIREKCPDMEIYLQSCIPECIAVNESNKKNEKIDEYNQRLKVYAEENGYHFVDIAPYAEDHLNRMPEDYNLDDGIHLNEKGCVSWMQALIAYAQWQNQEG